MASAAPPAKKAKTDDNTAMWDIMLVDCRIATMVPGGQPYGAVGASGDRASGVIGIVGDRIAFVGTTADLPGDHAGAKEVRDMQGRWVTPGLIDCHTHIVYGPSARLAARATFFPAHDSSWSAVQRSTMACADAPFDKTMCFPRRR